MVESLKVAAQVAALLVLFLVSPVFLVPLVQRWPSEFLLLICLAVAAFAVTMIYRHIEESVSFSEGVEKIGDCDGAWHNDVLFLREPECPFCGATWKRPPNFDVGE